MTSWFPRFNWPDRLQWLVVAGVVSVALYVGWLCWVATRTLEVLVG